MGKIENKKSVGMYGDMCKCAGHKTDTGKFGEPASVLHVPLSQSAKN